MITADMMRPGAVVLDFGANVVGGQMPATWTPRRHGGGRLASRPCPGGTGPMTNAMLIAQPGGGQQATARLTGVARLGPS
jgi:methylenetetrahydrofolate dehydrogenase (NADP+)/methenyltetrahydrofolate cyclohydrolase